MADAQTMKNNWADPVYRARMIAGMKSPEAKARAKETRAKNKAAKEAAAEALKSRNAEGAAAVTGHEAEEKINAAEANKIANTTAFAPKGKTNPSEAAVEEKKQADAKAVADAKAALVEKKRLARNERQRIRRASQKAATTS